MLQGADTFLKPESVISQLDIQQGMRVADFGCGHGFFAIAIAKAIGETGHVYALDVIQTALDVVKEKAAKEQLNNIEIIRCNLETHRQKSILDSSLDLVLLTSTLFQTKQKSEIIKEALRVLKSQGHLLIIDWQKDALMAPKEFWLLSKEKMTDLVEAEGFNLEKDIAVDHQHYGLLFSKK